MRVACIYIPRYYVQLERARCPELMRRPVVIGGLPEEKGCVLDCSREAAERGISPSMSLREAYHLCPEAVFLLFKEGRYRASWEELIYALGTFSLRIESKEQGMAYLDITKSMKLHGGEEAWGPAVVRMLAESFKLQGKVGIGNSRFVAFRAALDATPVSIIPEGREATFLSPLPVATLPIDDEVKERLRHLGLKTLARVRSLSCEDLTSQFGSAGTLMWKLAVGTEETNRILKRRWRVHIEKEVVAETAFETTAELEQAVDGSLGEIVSELKETGRSCRKLKLLLYLPHGQRVVAALTMKNPTDSKQLMLARVMNNVPCMAIEAPIAGFHLSASGLCKTEGEQESLFRKRQRLNEKLEGVKGYLSARYGESPLFTVEEKERDALLPERKYVFKKV